MRHTVYFAESWTQMLKIARASWPPVSWLRPVTQVWTSSRCLQGSRHCPATCRGSLQSLHSHHCLRLLEDCPFPMEHTARFTRFTRILLDLAQTALPDLSSGLQTPPCGQLAYSSPYSSIHGASMDFCVSPSEAGVCHPPSRNAAPSTVPSEPVWREEKLRTTGNRKGLPFPVQQA